MLALILVRLARPMHIGSSWYAEVDAVGGDDHAAGGDLVADLLGA